jgi:UDPglucose 6-dehydrogenase
MKIAIVGAGYVGLTTGACLADLGHSVTCIDIDGERVERLRAGELPIFEPGLKDVIARARAARRLRFGVVVPRACADADAIFLAVGTPSRADGAIDLSYIEAAARQIAPAMRRDAVVVIKSTVIAGTARRLREIIAEARGGLDFSVASNPEFLREGSAVDDFMRPDRIVIGADDPRAAKVLEKIYAPLLARKVPCLATSTINAEMIKYAANAFLALKIGFINDVADLCDRIGGDVGAIAEGMGLDHRIGKAFLAAGPGYGGSCFPKDTRALAAIGRLHGAPQHSVEALIRQNEERKSAIARRILDELGRPARGARIAVLGVAFKANTDDVRESAALAIIPALQAAGCKVAAHDPAADPASLPAGVVHCGSAYEAATGAAMVVILTEWDEYRRLDLKRLGEAMSGRSIFDCRNLLDPAAVAAQGFSYCGIGRGTLPPRAKTAARSAAGRYAPDTRVAASPA